MLSLSLGPFSLPLSHLILFSALLFALVVGAIAGGKKRATISGSLLDIFLISLVFARIGFVILYFEHYQNSLWRIVDIRDGGFNIPTGLTAALIICLWKLWQHRDIRKPLSMALVAGLASWGTLSGLSLIDRPSQQLPELDIHTLDSNVVSLHNLTDGQPVVINLWASWCPACLHEMPVLQMAREQHPEITFIFVNQGEQPDVIRDFLYQHDLPADNMFTDIASRFGDVVGSQALPVTLFYDAHGQRVNAHIGMLSQASLAHKLKSIKTH